MNTIPHVATRFKTNQNYLLSKAITAFSLSRYCATGESYGGVCELPQGASIQICGAGFNDRTLKARCGDSYYHVFYRDLSSAMDTQNQPVDFEHFRPVYI